jgi:tRNA (guanine37-N1)-methyltransferase
MRAGKKVVFLSLFPELLKTVCETSILKRAQEEHLLELFFIQIRDFSLDKHRTVDASPYGGGEGMLLRVDVLYRGWEAAIQILKPLTDVKPRTIYLSPQGAVLTQEKARALAEPNDEPLILVCGHYEGIDERFLELCVDEELSIGDYVLTGGELPAAVLVDALVRWIPGALGNELSAESDSLSPAQAASEGGLLKYPQYTRPPTFQDKGIPEVLLSGNHGKIEAWRKAQRLAVTQRKRPDLLKKP